MAEAGKIHSNEGSRHQEREAIVWNAHGKAADAIRLIDPVTLRIEPLKKEDYATWRIEIDYDPKATCRYGGAAGDYFVDHTPEEKAKSITLYKHGTTLIDRLPKALKGTLVLLGPTTPARAHAANIIGADVKQTDLDGTIGDETKRTGWKSSPVARLGCSMRRSA